MLLAAFDERRPTRDVDLLARATPNTVDAMSDLVGEVITTVDVEDGVAYEIDGMRSRAIREGQIYAGVRVVVPARVARASHPLRVDINLGDPVTPEPIIVDYPSLLGPTFPVVSYPLQSVLAEKIVTMIDRGDATTRERDFADVLLTTARHPIDADQLHAAIAATASHRGSDVRPLEHALIDLGTERQADWQRYLRRSGLSTLLPEHYSDAIIAVSRFADPIITRSVRSGSWDPSSRAWVTAPSQET